MNDCKTTGPSFWDEVAANGVTPEEALGVLVNTAGSCGPWLDAEYAGPSDISNLLGLARHFSLFTEAGYRSLIIGLETALTDGPLQTDLCVGLHRQNFALAGGPIAAKFAPRLHTSPLWGRVFAFLHRWLTEEPFASKLFEHLWLEFDTGGGEEGPTPNIFFGCRPTGAYLAMVASCLESLGLPAGLDCWRKVVAGVEGRAAMLQIGAMLGRPSAPLRVVALEFTPGTGDYVLDVGCRAFAGDNARRWSELAPFRDGLSGVSLDVDWRTGETGPRVGVEYNFAYCKDHPQERRRRLESFFGHLAEQGWCCWPKAEAVLNFPRQYTCQRNGLAAGTLLQTDLSHIKLDFSPGGLPRVKAYGELIMVETGRTIEKGVRR